MQRSGRGQAGECEARARVAERVRVGFFQGEWRSDRVAVVCTHEM
jgi:hypothetical protein